MPSKYSGRAANVSPQQAITIACPVDHDPANAASVNVPLQKLADWIDAMAMQMDLIRIDNWAEQKAHSFGASPINDVAAAVDGSLFVAVGNTRDANTNLETSVDGVSWVARPSGTAALLQAVAHNGSLWVVVGAGGAILTSPDAKAWTARPSGVTDALWDVAWSPMLKLWCAGGENMRILTSPDGITWTNRPHSLGGTGTVNRIAWGNRTFVIRSYSCPQGIATSPDGITWTGRTLPAVGAWPTLVGFEGLTYVTTLAGSFFIAGAGNSAQPNQALIFTSPDGVTWTLRLTRNGYQPISDFVSTGRHVVGVMASAGEPLYVSEDGVRFAQREALPGVQTSASRLAFNGRVLVAVGGAGIFRSFVVGP